MLLLIPLLPFLGFLLNASLGRRISKPAAGAVACGAMIASFAVSAWAVAGLVAMVPDARVVDQTVFNWFSSGAHSADVATRHAVTGDFALRLDPLSAVMILVVT